MKFKIKHLLILMFIAASVAFFAQPKKPKFRHETLEDAAEIASLSDWQVVGNGRRSARAIQETTYVSFRPECQGVLVRLHDRWN